MAFVAIGFQHVVANMFVKATNSAPIKFIIVTIPQLTANCFSDIFLENKAIATDIIFPVINSAPALN